MTAVEREPRLQVPLGRPFFGPEEERAVLDVLRSGWVTQGPVVQRFEEAIAGRLGVGHVVAVTSATIGLQAALTALGIGPGDEVVCPSYTYIATPNSIVNSGATPVFADVDPRTWALDPAAVEAVLTPRTAAVMPVHMGYPADVAALRDVAARHGLAVVEDAAPAIGARYPSDAGGAWIGSSTGPVVFSFHPRKIVTTGEGGVVCTDDAELARRLRLLRHHHMSISDVERHAAGGLVVEEYGDIGHNWRMTDLQAAVGVAQVGKLDTILRLRAHVAARYDEAFAGREGLGRRTLLPGATDAHQNYSLELRPGVGTDRDALMGHLQRHGVTTRRGIMSSHLEPAYRRRSGELRLPVSERLSATTLQLPVFAGMREEEVEHVVSGVLGGLGAG